MFWLIVSLLRTFVGHHFLEKVELVIADPRDKQAGKALSAIIQAMTETDMVAIVRYVKVLFYKFKKKIK